MQFLGPKGSKGSIHATWGPPFSPALYEPFYYTMSEDEEGVGAPLLPVLCAEVLRIELCRIGIVPLVHHDSGGRSHHRHALDGEESLMTSAKDEGRDGAFH